MKDIQMAELAQCIAAVFHRHVLEAMEDGCMFSAIMFQEKRALYSRGARQNMGLES